VLDNKSVENEKGGKIAVQPFSSRLAIRKPLLKSYKIRGVGVKQGVRFIGFF